VCHSFQENVSEPKIDTLAFEPPVIMPVVPLFKEISGIIVSKANPGYLWALEDSGNPPELLLLTQNGMVSKKLRLKDATNRDWEDMAIAGNQLYVGDIGDNALKFSDYTIYQFTEPASSVTIINDYKTIRFKYPDGAHDAEAFLVDPVKKDIYIITKRDKPSRIYKLAYPQSYASMNTASYVGSLPYSGVVSASISSDAKSIIIKTYVGLRLYQEKKGNVDLTTVLAGSSINLPYRMEPQGEAVTFASDGSGYYTLSEKGFSKNVNLYFYRKK
jgi:hypothetical protein